MIWKPVVGFEDWYEVSDEGQVRRMSNGFILKHSKDRYPRVTMYIDGKKHRRLVHLIVLESFVGPKPLGQEANHKDFVRTNARLDNLEYMTHLKNVHHSLKHLPRGEKHHNAKLTNLEARSIRALQTCGWSQRKLARTFGVSQGTICHLLAGSVWKTI